MPQHGDAAGTSSRQAVQFHCTLAGKAKGGPVLDRTAVCARFARAIETALGVRLVEILTPPQAGKGRWISIEVRLGPPAHAEARFASRLGRAATKHVPIGIDIMDKELDLRDIDSLAAHVAQALRTAD